MAHPSSPRRPEPCELHLLLLNRRRNCAQKEMSWMQIVLIATAQVQTWPNCMQNMCLSPHLTEGGCLLCSQHCFTDPKPCPAKAVWKSAHANPLTLHDEFDLTQSSFHVVPWVSDLRSLQLQGTVVWESRTLHSKDPTSWNFVKCCSRNSESRWPVVPKEQEHRIGSRIWLGGAEKLSRESEKLGAWGTILFRGQRLGPLEPLEVGVSNGVGKDARALLPRDAWFGWRTVILRLIGLLCSIHSGTTEKRKTRLCDQTLSLHSSTTKYENLNTKEIFQISSIFVQRGQNHQRPGESGSGLFNKRWQQQTATRMNISGFWTGSKFQLQCKCQNSKRVNNYNLNKNLQLELHILRRSKVLKYLTRRVDHCKMVLLA